MKAPSRGTVVRATLQQISPSRATLKSASPFSRLRLFRVPGCGLSAGARFALESVSLHSSYLADPSDFLSAGKFFWILEKVTADLEGFFIKFIKFAKFINFFKKT